jgi:hypothetical protein
MRPSHFWKPTPWGGIEGQRKKLKSEGQRILKKGGKFIVENLPGALIQMD